MNKLRLVSQLLCLQQNIWRCKKSACRFRNHTLQYYNYLNGLLNDNIPFKSFWNHITVKPICPSHQFPNFHCANWYDKNSMCHRNDPQNLQFSCTPQSALCCSLLTYNLSGVSLSDLDNPAAMQPKARLYQQRPHTGQAEFMGLSLPVDINMIFEVFV